MTETLDATLPMARQGYCCSQILVKLILDAQGEENTGLLRALQGLCRGMVGGHSVCGLLTGGMCALAYVTGKGSEEENADIRSEEIRYEYLTWFRELTREYGGLKCSDILGGYPENHDDNCNRLLTECWGKIVIIFDYYNLDWTMSRE